MNEAEQLENPYSATISGADEEELGEIRGNLLLISKLVFLTSIVFGLLAAKAIVSARWIVQGGFFEFMTWVAVVYYYDLIFVIVWPIVAWYGISYSVLLRRFVERGEQDPAKLIQAQTYFWLGMGLVVAAFIVRAILTNWAYVQTLLAACM